MIPFSRSLLARTSAVLVAMAAIISATAVVSLNFYMMSPLLESSVKDRAALLVLTARTWMELDDDRKSVYEIEMHNSQDLDVNASPRDFPVVPAGERYFDLLVSELNQQLDVPVKLMRGDERLWVNISIGNGTPLQIGFSPQLPQLQLLYVWLPLFIASATFILLIAFLVVRRITQPVTEVSERASSFRGEVDFEPLPEVGPDEFVVLASSFNRMAEEISSLIANRTTLLAGISHDIRTPLTRMMLAVEMLPDSVDPVLIERFKRNLNSIDSLISDAASFVKGVYEQPEEVEFEGFLHKTIDAVDAGVKTTWAGDKPLTLEVAQAAFQRVMNNLIGNAIQHADGARVQVEVDGEEVQVHVLDDGPGIPPEDRSRVLQPFVRLDTARSSQTGGSGLGLAIVSQLCEKHGWRVKIDASDTGGTDAVLFIPRNVADVLNEEVSIAK